MCDLKECIKRIRENTLYLQQEYGVTALTLFGSTARGSNTPESDIDLFVEMPPQGLKLVNLQFYLEDLLTSKVDLVRRHSHIDPFFLSEIKRDGIRII